MNGEAINKFSNLVHYSDSSDSNDDQIPIKKSKLYNEEKSIVSLPSVPKEILNMFDISKEHREDSPENHDGRIRSFEHERGNWASFIYYPVKMSASFENIIDDIFDVLNLDNEFKNVKDVHLSLSKTLVLRHHWIDPLKKQLNKVMSNVTPFWCQFNAVKFYCNDENTRTFIGFEVFSEMNQLNNLVKIIDDCLKEYKLPLYYEDPSFHLSFGWTLGDASKLISNKCKIQIQEIIDENRMLDSQDFLLFINHLNFKAGNNVFEIKFNQI